MDVPIQFTVQNTSQKTPSNAYTTHSDIIIIGTRKMICVLPLGVDDIVVITREEKSDNDFDLEFRDSHAGTRVTALEIHYYITEKAQ